MSIQFRSASDFSSATAPSGLFILSRPPNLQPDDLQFAVVWWYNGGTGASVSMRSRGWTVVSDGTLNSSYDYAILRAPSSVDGYAFDYDSFGHADARPCGFTFAYSGVDPTTPLDVVETNNYSFGSTHTLTGLGLTTATDAAVIVGVHLGLVDGNEAPSVVWGTLQAYRPGTSFYAYQGIVVDGIQNPAGPTGNKAITLPTKLYSANFANSVLFALRPYSGGASGEAITDSTPSPLAQTFDAPATEDTFNLNDSTPSVFSQLFAAAAAAWANFDWLSSLGFNAAAEVLTTHVDSSKAIPLATSAAVSVQVDADSNKRIPLGTTGAVSVQVDAASSSAVPLNTVATSFIVGTGGPVTGNDAVALPLGSLGDAIHAGQWLVATIVVAGGYFDISQIPGGLDAAWCFWISKRTSRFRCCSTSHPDTTRWNQRRHSLRHSRARYHSSSLDSKCLTASVYEQCRGVDVDGRGWICYHRDGFI
jgi:hypothetical protein